MHAGQKHPVAEGLIRFTRNFAVRFWAGVGDSVIVSLFVPLKVMVSAPALRCVI